RQQALAQPSADPAPQTNQSAPTALAQPATPTPSAAPTQLAPAAAVTAARLPTTPEQQDFDRALATELDQAWQDERDESTPADISLNFENASLLNFLKKIETLFNVSFMFDEDLKASSKESKAGKDVTTGTGPYDQPKEPHELASKSGLENSRISFATNQPLTKNELWHLTDQFLQVAGYARVRIPGVKQAIYRITNLNTALQEVLPVLINVAPSAITETGVIRYVYFLHNSTPQQMLEVLDKLKSKTARIIPFTNLKALIFTDTADNIKALMQIVQELDQANTPEMLSVIKLQKADANEIADLIKRLAGTKEGDRYGYQSPFLRTNKLSTTLKEARVIVESRANTLLVLGTRAAIATIEEIVREFDTDLQKPKNQIWVVPLNFMSAKQMAQILNDITQFGSQLPPPAGNIPGQARLQGTERLFGQMQFEPEAQGNNLIVRGAP
ncbi:MAG TPA: secretin N-terminal domain-containing protein, partial [Candidatus Babeliales bacterium]|nr:secretin N-terminal domain-containing protein [Candidatus Babeliales bacterium]